MTRTFSFFLCSCFLWIELIRALPRGLQAGVADGGHQDNPGFKMRITQSALDYVETLAQKAMKDQFPRIRISDVHGDIQNGDVHLTDMRITKYKPAEKHTIALEPPDQVRWTTADADISLYGNFDSRQQGLISKVQSAGQFDADAQNVDFTLSFSFYKADDGGLTVKDRQCAANVKTLNANVKTTTASLGNGFVSLFKNSVVQQMRPIVATEMCQEAKRFVDVELNKQLGTMPKRLFLNQTNYNFKKAQRDVRPTPIGSGDNDYDSLSHVRSSTTTTKSNINSSDKDKHEHNPLRNLASTISQHLVLDYSFTKDPIVTSKYIESSNRGEISYEGQGGTPFYPHELQESQPIPTDRMLYLIASDYVVNSLFWHAYKHGLLTFQANGQQNPEYKNMLRTSCDDDVFAVCLGNVVPEVGQSFPQSDVEIVFQNVQAPVVYFEQNHQVKLVAPSYVVVYAKKNNELQEMMTCDLFAEAQLKVWIDDLLVKGNGTITKFNMTLRNNNLKNFDQNKLNEFSNMAKAMFQELVNNELMKGLPLPTIEGATLVKPILRIFERTVRVETDIEVDEDVLTLLAIEALRNGNSKVTIDENP